MRKTSFAVLALLGLVQVSTATSIKSQKTFLAAGPDNDATCEGKCDHPCNVKCAHANDTDYSIVEATDYHFDNLLQPYLDQISQA